MSELRIAPVDIGAIDKVVSIHTAAFPDSAITAFGVETVCRYYRWLLEGPHDAAIMGAWVGQELVGFCAAGVFRGAMNGFLRRNRVYLLKHLLRHPSLLGNALVRDRVKAAAEITVRFSRRRAKRSIANPAAPSFGVLSIATDPHRRVRGAGRALMAEAEDRARRSGFKHMVLTVHPENRRAVEFYECLGWVRTGAAPWSGSMRRDL